MDLATKELTVDAIAGARRAPRPDRVAIEEPLELRIGDRALTITMRTPGEDGDLAVGFLFSEGIVRSRADVAGVRSIEANVVSVELAPGVPLPFDRKARSFTTTSSCGVCGKTSLDQLAFARPQPTTRDTTIVRADVIHGLAAVVRRAQAAFEHTGGLHASALFDERGALLAVREDVGRHNALDKLIGAELMAGRLPLRGRMILVSGRASFELVQKAAMSEVPILAAVGAPSSLAVELATECQMTLLGFVRDERFNIYAGRERIEGIEP